MLTRFTKLVPANSPVALGVAAGCVVTAIAARLGLDAAIGLGAIPPFVTMFPAVLVAAVIGGMGAGLLAIVLSTIATWYLFIPPFFSFPPPSVADMVTFALYLMGTLLIVVVATSLRRAVENLETAQAKLFAALNASGTGTWRFDIQRDQLEWDSTTANVFGVDPANPPRRADEFLSLLHPDDREEAKRIVRRAIARRSTAEHEFRVVLPDGRERWICDRARVVYDPDNRPLYLIGASLDVTERKRADERQGLLLNELNHRVKNTLATVQSMALQTLRSSPDLDTFRDSFMLRLMALSATHDLLTRRMWESATLEELLKAELQPYGGIDQTRILAKGETVHLKPQQALALGMVFHELATNAAKHGALSSPKGRIRIAWFLEQASSEGRHLVFEWREESESRVEEPQRKGFGSRLIDRSIVHELGGSVEMSFGSSGFSCVFRLPLNTLLEAA